MKSILITIMLLVTSGTALSRGPIELDTKHPSVKSFELYEVCEQAGLKHILLAEAIGTNSVDCMGKKLTVTDFCKKKFPLDKKLLRGFINYQKMATCHFAESMILSLDCARFPKYCKDPKRGCTALQGVYAVTHTLTHSGKASHNSGDRLKCYYANSFTELE